MNWKNEAMEKLRRYHVMRQAAQNLPQEIHMLEQDALAIRSARTDGTPVKGGGNNREKKMLDNFVMRQELQENLRQTNLWLDSTDRALRSLSNDERLILHRMFILPERGSLERLQSELGVEQSTIYRKRDKALERFTLALYGQLES